MRRVAAACKEASALSTAGGSSSGTGVVMEVNSPSYPSRTRSHAVTAVGARRCTMSGLSRGFGDKSFVNNRLNSEV